VEEDLSKSGITRGYKRNFNNVSKESKRMLGSFQQELLDAFMKLSAELEDEFICFTARVNF